MQCQDCGHPWDVHDGYGCTRVWHEQVPGDQSIDHPCPCTEASGGAPVAYDPDSPAGRIAEHRGDPDLLN